MIEIKNAVTPNSEQMDSMIDATMNAYGVEYRAESKSGLGCSERLIWGNPEWGDLFCKDCGYEMITGSCPGIDRHYILCESDKELLLRDKVGFMSYLMVYFTIIGPLHFIRDFINFDLFLDGCDDIFHTILMPHFVKHNSSDGTNDLCQKCYVMINYSALSNMYTVYKDSKDKDWQWICKWIGSLPYSELITSRSCN